jgi:hypothetical protein
MFGVYCPKCGSNKSVIIGVERNGNKKRYIFFCSFCESDWPEEIAFPEGDETRNMEIDSILLGLEIFEVAAECSVALEHSQEEGTSVSRKEKDKCLEELKYLQSLLSKIENEWGLLRLKKILISYNENVEWGLKELDNLFEHSEGKIKEEVEKIIIYLRIAKRTKISSLR